MRGLMIVFLFIQVSVCYAQQQNPYENDNFKLVPPTPEVKEIIFKNSLDSRVLKVKDTNPFLKLGLPFQEGYNEDSNICWMSYDSSLHHIEMIDTLLKDEIINAEVVTFNIVKVYKKHIIISNGVMVNVGEWNKELKRGGQIYDKNMKLIYSAEGSPFKGINLGQARIDTSGNYLVTIRSEKFEEYEGGQIVPLDFFMDIFSLPELKLLKTEKVSSSNLNYKNGRIWHITSDYDYVTKKHSKEVFFLDFNKNKKYTIYPENSFGFNQSIEKCWLREGILLQGKDNTYIEKLFDRDFIVEDIFKK